MNKKYGKWGWSQGNLLNLALGQGDILVTPIQMVQFINQVVTHGNAGRLHLAEEKTQKKVIKNILSKNNWTILEKSLEATVKNNQGTGRNADPHINGLIIGGKTGTAENPHGNPHAWFIGFGKKGDSTITSVILIENGGHGGEIAAQYPEKYFLTIFLRRASI